MILCANGNVTVNKRRQYVLAIKIDLLWDDCVTNHQIKQTLCVSQLTDLVMGTFGIVSVYGIGLRS